MEPTKLAKPLPLTPEAAEVCAKAGIVLSAHTKDGARMRYHEDEEGYTKVTLTKEPSACAKALSFLSPKDLKEVYAASPGAIFDIVEEAMDWAQLRRVAAAAQEAYPIVSDYRSPIDIDYAFVETEVARLSEEAKAQALDQVRFGFEAEFSLPEEPLPGFSLAKEVKETVLKEIDEAYVTASASERRALKKRRAAIEKFNAREMLMLDLIERDERTRDILEYLFGAGHDGNGYYDGQNCLELKLAHAEVTEILPRYRTLLRVLCEKASAYGLVLWKPPSLHLSFSCWQDGQNLFDPAHPRFAIYGAEIAESVTQALYHAAPLLIADYMWNKEEQGGIDLPLHREGFTRSATGRYEIRPQMEGFYQNPFLLTAVAMAGIVASGLGLDRDWGHAARIAKSPVIWHKPGAFKVISHLLNNAEIHDGERLSFSAAYVESHADMMAYELGLLQEKPVASFWSMFLGCDQRKTKPIIQFFRKARLLTGNKIKWPQQEPGRYTFATKEVNMDKLPPDLQEKMRAGIEVPRDVLSEYVGVGDYLPKASETFTIDTARLARGVKLVGICEKLVIDRPYDLNREDKGLSLEQARLMRMAESPILRAAFSAPMREALETALADKIGASFERIRPQKRRPSPQKEASLPANDL